MKDTSCATSLPPQVFRYEEVVWDPEDEIHRLKPLLGDTVAFGFAINNSGQVVGGSGSCANTAPPPGPLAPHAVLWEKDGTTIDLGSQSGPGTEPNEAAQHQRQGRGGGRLRGQRRRHSHVPLNAHDRYARPGRVSGRSVDGGGLLHHQQKPRTDSWFRNRFHKPNLFDVYLCCLLHRQNRMWRLDFFLPTAEAEKSFTRVPRGILDVRDT